MDLEIRNKIFVYKYLILAVFILKKIRKEKMDDYSAC